MLVTADVLKKFGPNRRDVRDEHPLNINPMLVAPDVSKFDKSK